jgi:hypothetical protein
MTTALEGGEGVSVTPRPLFTPGKDPVPIVQEAGWVPGAVWRGAENLAPTGIRSSDRAARSQSLYRLSYKAHSNHSVILKKTGWSSNKKPFQLSENTGYPTRYGTRHFFNNSNTNEGIATKLEQGYVRCVRKEEGCVCSVCL